MNFGDRIQKLGGFPTGFGESVSPAFGNVYFVDGTNGDSGNDGDNPSEALDTITNAITAQTAATGSLGDVIYVLPGTYAESVTGSLTGVQVIGAGVTPYSVQIAPIATYAYTGAMTRAALRNLKFVSSSSTNPEYPAVLITSNMMYSVIDNCHFTGGHDDALVGLHLGAVTAHTGWEQVEFSRITNNLFAADASHQFETAINVFGFSGAKTGHSTKIIKSSLIADNWILAKYWGIRLNLGEHGTRGSMIRGNTITSSQTNYGCGYAGIKTEAANEDELCYVIGNYVHATISPNAIEGFGSQFIMGNIVSYSAGDPDTLYPAEA